MVCHEQMWVNKASCGSQKLTNCAIAIPTPTPAGNDANRRAITTLDLVAAESGVRTIRENRNSPTATAAPASAHSHQEKRGWVGACPGKYRRGPIASRTNRRRAPRLGHQEHPNTHHHPYGQASAGLVDERIA